MFLLFEEGLRDLAHDAGRLRVIPLRGGLSDSQDSLVDALMRASAKQKLSELLRVSQRLSLTLVIGHFS